MDKTLHLRWWFIPAAEVPRDETRLTGWLYHWWETIDTWITTTSAAAQRAQGGRGAGVPGMPDAAGAPGSEPS